MRSTRVLVLGAACAAFAAACVDRLDLPCSPDVPLPAGFSSFGDGRGGARTIAAGETAVLSSCQRVSIVDGGRVTVLGPPIPAAGDAVLFHVVQDLEAAGRRAGTWAIARVTSVELPSTLVLAGPLPDARRSIAQVCTVPELTSLTVASGGTIAAVPWDGTDGGVAAVIVSGALMLDGSIVADGAGFRGGPENEEDSTSDRDQTGENVLSHQGGGKGESIDSRAFGLYGRGALGNGGGGGNAMNAGGGGGAAGGAGGLGGTERENGGMEDPRTRGRGGAATPAGRATLGGGGGAGHVTVVGTSSPGGRGGGVVIVIAQSLSGSGAVRARGLDATPAVDRGGGGGGAGGAVMLHAGSASFFGTIDVRGGAGGSTSSPGAVRGPGGGGGGGRVHASGVGSASILVTGGPAGTNALGSWGSSDGENGVVE